MKKLYSSLLLSSIIFFSAQVGINTRNPNASAALDIFSASKGVTFPKVVLQGRNDISTVPGSSESLAIYNTNNTISGKKGFYFWDGSKWDYFFSDINQANLMNHLKYYSSSSSTAYTFTRNSPNQFFGYSAHITGEVLNTTQWTVISALTKNIVIDRSSNEVLMNINGMYQANNTTNTSGIMSTIGFFIDDKLVDVKPIYLDFNSNCSYRQFMIYGITNNLLVGNHTVKFAIRNISSPNTTGLTVTYGGPNPSSTCNSLSSFESAISSTISINQPYVF